MVGKILAIAGVGLCAGVALAVIVAKQTNKKVSELENEDFGGFGVDDIYKPFGFSKSDTLDGFGNICDERGDECNGNTGFFAGLGEKMDKGVSFVAEKAKSVCKKAENFDDSADEGDDADWGEVEDFLNDDGFDAEADCADTSKDFTFVEDENKDTEDGGML